LERLQRGEGNRNITMSGIVESCSLSPRERARVRGNETLLVGRPWTFPTIIELSESPGGAGGFPTK